MRDGVRAGDVIGRYGGEEFVFVFPDARAAEACDLRERLRVELQGALSSGESPGFTVSFGVTDTTLGGTVDDALRRADEALLVAKRTGRDRVVVGGLETAGSASERAASLQQPSA